MPVQYAPPARDEPILCEPLRELFALLAKAQRDFKTYPRNNPILARRTAELHQKLVPILAVEADLAVEVRAEELRYRGVDVYRNTDPRESFCFHLYRHGIRELSFHEGLRADELESFIDSLNTALALSELDDDLSTLLWERDLRHIRYVAVDDLPDGAPWARDPVAAARSFIDQIPESAPPACYQSALREAAARPPQALPDSAAILLSESDQLALREALADDERRDLPLDVVDVLYEVLRSPLTPQGATEIARVLQRIVESSIEERAFSRAAKVLAHIAELSKVPEAARAIEPVRHELADRRFIKRIVQLCNEAPPDVKELYSLVVNLGIKAGAPLAEFLSDVQDRRLRRVICEATAELVGHEVNALAPVTRHPRWFVPRNVAFILGLTRNVEGLKILRSLAEHSSEKVRFEALRSASQFEGPQTRDLVYKALSDPDRAVRLLGLELAPTYVDPSMVQALVLRYHSEKAHKESDLSERRALAGALARSAGAEVLHVFKETVLKRGLLRAKKIDDGKVASVYGLVVIGTPAAEEVLLQAKASDPDFAAIIDDARHAFARTKEVAP